MPALAMKWDIANRCNLRCQHCGAADHIAPGAARPDEARLLAAADRIADLGIDQVVLIGGEPLTLGPALWRVVRRLVDSGVGVSVSSNATLFDQESAAKLATNGVRHLVVSLDGAREANDLLRGAGVFDRATAGIKQFGSACRANGLDATVEINTVVNRYNARNLADMLPVLEDLQAERWNLIKLVEVGQAAREMDALALTDAETIDAGLALAEALGRARWRPSLTMGALYPLTADYIHARTGVRLEGAEHCCHAGVYFFYMDSELRVYPCDRVRDRVGGAAAAPCILDDDFDLAATRTKPPVSELMDHIIDEQSYARLEPCSDCEYLWGGRCIPCALVGSNGHRTMTQCAEVLKRDPEIMSAHKADRQRNPFFQQFLRNGRPEAPAIGRHRLAPDEAITVADDAKFTAEGDSGYLFGARTKELVELTSAQVALLTIILEARSVAAGMAEVQELFPHLEKSKIERFLLRLLAIGLCQQKPRAS